MEDGKWQMVERSGRSNTPRIRRFTIYHLPSSIPLLAIQLDDQLLLHGQVDLRPGRQRLDPAGHRGGVEREPLGDPAALHFFHRVYDRRRLGAGAAHGHRVASLELVRRDVHLAAVHHEVAMAHELARLRAGGGEAEPVDHIVHPPFEELQQRLARDAARAIGDLEVAPELVLEHPVDTLDLLLFTQLETVADELRLPQLAVLSGRQIALLDRALLRVAALSLEKQLHAFTTAQTADRSDVTSHSFLTF